MYKLVIRGNQYVQCESTGRETPWWNVFIINVVDYSGLTCQAISCEKVLLMSIVFQMLCSSSVFSLFHLHFCILTDSWYTVLFFFVFILAKTGSTEKQHISQSSPHSFITAVKYWLISVLVFFFNSLWWQHLLKILTYLFKLSIKWNHHLYE